MECASKKKEFFLSQEENSTWNVFANLELDLEFLVQEEQKEDEILTYNVFVQGKEGRREEELDFEYFCPRG